MFLTFDLTGGSSASTSGRGKVPLSWFLYDFNAARIGCNLAGFTKTSSFDCGIPNRIIKCWSSFATL